MGRGSERYSEQQREAIVRAVLGRGMTDKGAAAAAASGELLDGLEPFRVPASTVRYLVGKAQQQAVGDARAQLRVTPELDPLADRGRALYEGCAGVLEEQVERLAATASGRDWTREDFDALRACQRAVKELIIGARLLARKSATQPSRQDDADADPELSPGVVRILERHRRDSGGAAQASP